MPIQWEQSYSVNVREIDDQHKNFIDLLNRSYNLINSGSNKENLKSILADLISYAKNHFETEEKYFDLYKYKNSAEHKEEHRKLERQVLDFQNDFLSGKKDIIVELINFLEDWLVDHLDNQDKKYVKCFNKNGLF
jgi:hemerythrin